ncbi:unnamed protein product, partial [Rhizoctonia solani]
MAEKHGDCGDQRAFGSPTPQPLDIFISREAPPDLEDACQHVRKFAGQFVKGHDGFDSTSFKEAIDAHPAQPPTITFEKLDFQRFNQPTPEESTVLEDVTNYLRNVCGTEVNADQLEQKVTGTFMRPQTKTHTRLFTKIVEKFNKTATYGVVFAFAPTNRASPVFTAMVIMVVLKAEGSVTYKKFTSTINSENYCADIVSFRLVVNKKFTA